MYKFTKRLLDFILAFLLLLLISPLFILIILLIKIKIGSPVFFLQERTGMNKQKFNIIKFRTMTNSTDKNGNLLPDEERFTTLGRFLRTKSLDELPELINIIKGEMSIIGPRPLPPVYDSYYTELETKRFNVRSGLIPPDSVDKNPIISWDKQLEYEARYADNLSLMLDIKILLNVFRIIFKRTEVDYGGFVRKPLNIERIKNK